MSVAPRAQENPPQAPGVPVQPPPRDGSEVLVDAAVAAMQGKNVRAIRVERAERDGVLRAVEGASAESFVRNLQTRVGQPFEARKVSADCMNLWSERRVIAQAYVEEIDGEVQVVFVIEREVEVYEGVDFHGLDAIDRATVDSLLGLSADRQVTRTEGEAMRKVLIARYRRDGYALCSIDLRESPVPDAPPSTTPTGQRLARPLRRLAFHIDEGPKVTVGAVKFLGNKSFAADPIFGVFGTDSYLVRDSHIQSDPSRALARGGPFSREVLEEDLDRLRLFYRSRGFLDATVDLAEAQFTPDRTSVDLSFVVVEGPRYRIKSVRVEHVNAQRQPLTAPPLYPASDVERELKVKPGEYYDHDRLQRDSIAITEFYGRRGHPPRTFPGMADVPGAFEVFTPLEVYGLEPEVDIVFHVFEGSPKRLRDVVIRGNRFTRDQVIRRRVRALPGDRIDMVEVTRALRSIEQTRFFQDPVTMRGPRLQMEPVAGSTDYVDIGLDVEDGATGELRWGVGISTGQGAQLQMTYNKRNFDLWNPPSSLNPITIIEEVLDNEAFHGGGQNLGLLLAPGSRQSQFQLTYLEPDVFRQHFDTWELRTSGQRRIRRLTDGYTSDMLGVEAGLSRNFTDHFNAGFSVRQEAVEIDDLAQDATSLAYDAEGQTELRGGRLSARFRDYDDLLRPTSGFELSLSGEVLGGPFGGEESLTKVTHSGHLYVPLAENEMKHRTVLHLEHYFGYAREFGGSDDVFLTERFYMGGYNLRGFDYRRAGPSQFGRPIGGEAIYTATAEVYFPLIATRLEGEVRDRELLRWLVFTDFGLLGLDVDDSSFGELRASSGIGIRIEIPYLDVPIALDLGWPWMYEETDDRRQLYFSISR